MVLLVHKKYTDICHQLLNDRKCYAIPEKDPTEAFLNDLQQIVVTTLDGGLISRDESQLVLVEHPRIATFYTLPKIQKGLTPLRGRPIVPDPKCQHLHRPDTTGLVRALPHIRDSSDLIKKIEGITVEEGTKLASIVVI